WRGDVGHRRDPREVDSHCGAGARGALDPDVTAVLLHDTVHRREAEPGPLAHALRGEERLEQVCLNLRTHAGSAIAHTEHRVGSNAGARMRLDERAVELDVAGLDGEPTALWHRVPGVDGEVQDDLLDLRRVGLDAAE